MWNADSSPIVAYTPSFSILRHRNARASALTIALSTLGRGAHAAPSGVTTSFRPPRLLNVRGMWTVIVSPSAETVARGHLAQLPCERLDHCAVDPRPLRGRSRVSRRSNASAFAG
jgi:hypothetical protein